MADKQKAVPLDVPAGVDVPSGVRREPAPGRAYDERGNVRPDDPERYLTGEAGETARVNAATRVDDGAQEANKALQEERDSEAAALQEAVSAALEGRPMRFYHVHPAVVAASEEAEARAAAEALADDDGSDAEVKDLDADDVPYYEDWLVDDLREELERRDLSKSGNKSELVARLYEHDAAE